MTVLMLEGLGATVRVAEDGAEGFAKVVKIAPERAHTRDLSQSHQSGMTPPWCGLGQPGSMPILRNRLPTRG